MASILLLQAGCMLARLIRRHPSVPAVVAGAGGVYLLHALVFGWYVADDAGISLAYARNIVSGYGPVLYPGAPAVEGYSNPLWVAILAVGVALQLDGGYGIPLLKILGLAFGAGTLALTWILARTAYGEHSAVAWLAPALLAIWTPFVFWSGGGLENALYAFVLVSAAILQLRELAAPARRPWSAVALLAAALTRPEGCAFFVAFLIHRLLAGGRRTGELKRLAAWTLIFVAGFGGFLLLRFYVFGAWLPNTYYAKVTDRGIGGLIGYLLDPEDRGRRYLVDFLRVSWPVLIAAAIGLADAARWRANLLIVGVLSGTALYVLYVGGDFWPAARFFTAVLPFAAVAAQHGVELAGRRVTWMRPAAAALLLALLASESVRASLALRARHHEDTLISLQGRIEQGEKVKGLAASMNIDDPLYMDPDIGGPTLVGLRILDLGGLTDIHIARFQYYPEFFRRYVFEEQRPHFIRTHASWTRSSRITQFPEFAEQYLPIRQYRDARGLHGLFVRKDVATGAAAQDRRSAAGQRRASFAQAREDAREVRRREQAREREGWIEYYGWRQRHDKLLAAFREAESAGTLPADPARLRELYFALLAAGDASAARRLAGAKGIETREATVLYDRAGPVLSLVDARFVQRRPDPTTWLILYFEPIEPRAAEYSLWLHIDPGRDGKRITRERELAPVVRAMEGGRSAALEIPLYVPPGEYDVRAGASRRDGSEALCTDPAGTRCYLLLGTHPIGR